MNLPTLTVEVAFRTDPDAAFPEWTDISADLLSLTSRRGRQRELDTVQAGTCELRLANGDRRYDPSYTKSPHYPYVLPMRKLRVSAVWAGVRYYLFTGYVERWPLTWEAPKWGSVSVTAVDGMAALAQASITGTFPEAQTGARVGSVLAAAAWPESTPLAGGYWVLGVSALGTSTILSYGVPTVDRDTGQTRVAEAVIADTDAVSALSHIQEMAQAERGVFFFDGEGTAVFQERNARYNTTSVVTFTDGTRATGTTNSSQVAATYGTGTYGAGRYGPFAPGPTAARLPYHDLEPEFDVERVVNEATVTRPGGVPQNAGDTRSRQKYFRRSLSLTLPFTTDSDARLRAGFEVGLRKQPLLEFPKLTVKPQGYTAAWPFALGLEIGDKVTVERTPASAEPIIAETIIRDCFVEAIEHTGSPAAWATSYQLSPAEPYVFWTFGTSALDTSTVLAY